MAEGGIDIKSILIADHDVHNRVVIREALWDFNLTFVESYQEAVNVLNKKSFHLLLINNRLPQKDGLRLLRDLNEQHQIPSILIIEEGNEKTAVQAMKLGVSDYLTEQELIPAILSMTVHRSIEHKKWERVYKDNHQTENNSYLMDPLTQVYNKCYFEMRLKEEIKRSRRYHFPVTMALFDIEHFHEINQQYGREAGDYVLKELGQMLNRDLRNSDLIARIGDDCFALLLPHTTEGQAHVVWRRILQGLSSHPFSVKGKNIFISVRGILNSLNKEIEQIDALLTQLKSYMKQDPTGEPLLLYQAEG